MVKEKRLYFPRKVHDFSEKVGLFFVILPYFSFLRAGLRDVIFHQRIKNGLRSMKSPILESQNRSIGRKRHFVAMQLPRARKGAHEKSGCFKRVCR